MRLARISLLSSSLLFISGLLPLLAQVQLERISIAERADGLGYVMRYHLTEMADSFRVVQPETNQIQMVLFSDGFISDDVTVSELPGEYERIEYYPLENGVGVNIILADETYFSTNAYPDVNRRDLLLAFERTDRQTAERIANLQEEIIWLDFGYDPGETEEPAQPVVEHDPDEEPVVVMDMPSRWSVDIGVKGGLSTANFYGVGYGRDARNEISFATAFTINMPYRLPYGIRPGIESGVYFTQKGFKNPATDKLVAVTVELDYIEIPVLAKFSYDATPIISPHLVLGPYVGFMINAERVRLDDSRRDLDDVTREVDVGGLAGIGVDFYLGDFVLNAQIRSSLGITSIFKTEDFNDGEKHRYFSVVAGFQF